MPRVSPEQLRTVVLRSLVLALWSDGRASADDALTVLPPAPRGHGVQLLGSLRRLAFTQTWVAGGRTGRPDPVTGTRPAVLFARTAGVGPDLARAPAPLVAYLDDSGITDLIGAAAPPSTLPLLADALTPRQAERRLDELTREAAARLTKLGLQRGRGDLAARLAELAHRHPSYPAALPADLRAALGRLDAIMDIVSLGLADEGAAVTAGEAEARAKPLRLLADQAADLLVAVANGHNVS